MNDFDLAARAPSTLLPQLRPLPDDAIALLMAVTAPPRLVAHLRLVHDVACELTDALRPRLGFDAKAVAFGAATHDIGKALHPSELGAPGHEHEAAGQRLLLSHGVRADYARFAKSHAGPLDEATGVEDLLVTLADKIWKGRREEALEQRIVERICRASGQPAWDVFMHLDDVLTPLAALADVRLEFQAGFAAA